MSRTLTSPVGSELEVRRSRFLGYVLPVDDREAALAELARLRSAHPGAAHVCWALLAGGQSGMSDDGEPSGTAGRPILEVLRHHELDGVLAAVVRYFGGVKLGAGGLVRAYTEATATALANAETVERVPETTLELRADYADAERVRRWADAAGYAEPDAEYGAEVVLRLRLPRTAREEAVRTIADLAQGRIRVEG